MVHLEGALTPEAGAALSTAIDAWSAPQPAADGTPRPPHRRPTPPRRAAPPRRLRRRRPGPAAHHPRQPLPGRGHRPAHHLRRRRSKAIRRHRDCRRPPCRRHRAVARQPCSTSLAATPRSCPILIDDLGNPLDVGDTQYAFPTSQRTAIALRDQHCTYPGCTAPRPGATSTTSPPSAKADEPPSTTARCCADATTATSTPPSQTGRLERRPRHLGHRTTRQPTSALTHAHPSRPNAPSKTSSAATSPADVADDPWWECHTAGQALPSRAVSGGTPMSSDDTPGQDAPGQDSARTTPWRSVRNTPVREFVRTETGSAALLVAAIVVALVWVAMMPGGLRAVLVDAARRSRSATPRSPRTCAAGSTPA